MILSFLSFHAYVESDTQDATRIMRGWATNALLGVTIFCLVSWALSALAEHTATGLREEKNKVVSRSSNTELRDNKDGEDDETKGLRGDMEEGNNTNIMNNCNNNYNSNNDKTDNDNTNINTYDDGNHH